MMQFYWSWYEEECMNDHESMNEVWIELYFLMIMVYTYFINQCLFGRGIAAPTNYVFALGWVSGLVAEPGYFRLVQTRKILDRAWWRIELKFMSKCAKLQVGAWCARWECTQVQGAPGCKWRALYLLEFGHGCSVGLGLVIDLVADLVLGNQFVG